MCKEGFKINPYDECIANKIINGKKCTVVWYVEDRKISHQDSAVVTEVIDLMKKYFGDLTVTRGNNHRLLGMNITIHQNKSIEIEMKDKLQEAIDIFTLIEGQDVIEIVTSQAQKDLKEVNVNCKILSKERMEAFHSIVAKLLWIMKRARPDLETSIVFLCTRVTKSDEDDWEFVLKDIGFHKVYHTLHENNRC